MGERWREEGRLLEDDTFFSGFVALFRVRRGEEELKGGMKLLAAEVECLIFLGLRFICFGQVFGLNLCA